MQYNSARCSWFIPSQSSFSSAPTPAPSRLLLLGILDAERDRLAVLKIELGQAGRVGKRLAVEGKLLLRDRDANLGLQIGKEGVSWVSKSLGKKILLNSNKLTVMRSRNVETKSVRGMSWSSIVSPLQPHAGLSG